MNSLFDILLPKPLPDAWLLGLLFAAFTLHLLFVLFTLGTAILAVYFFIHFRWSGKPVELELDRRILRSFMAHKSLAVVLGVGPLLLIQVGFPVTFFTAVNFFAPYWMLIILLLVIAFLLFDVLGHGIKRHPYAHLAVSLVALTSLLAVPGIFAAVLTVAENSDHWVTIARSGYRFSAPLAGYWLFRYLHVLGAAVVFGSAFHYFFSARVPVEQEALRKWLVAGILLQFVLGLLLFISLPQPPGSFTLGAMFAGIIAAVALLWAIYNSSGRGADLTVYTTFPLLAITLVAMLLTRQLIQDRQILPLERRAVANAAQYGKELHPYTPASLDRYRASLPLSFDHGGTIYSTSCAFCHGEDGRGDGPEAQNLEVPPQDLSAIRTTRAYLYRILQEGIPGTGMGYFTIYDRFQLDRLMDYLGEKFQVVGLPGEIPVAVPAPTLKKAQDTYDKTCAACHGLDGRGAELSRSFKPPPPDLAAYSLTPRRCFKVITDGYPETMMPSFAEYPPQVRWGLVQAVYAKRKIAQ